MSLRVFVSIELSQLTLSELEDLVQEAQGEIAKRVKELPPLSTEETALLSTRPIEAIKLYRNRVGCGLREAKDMIDRARGLRT